MNPREPGWSRLCYRNTYPLNGSFTDSKKSVRDISMSVTKTTLLGMPHGTASARLLKSILFDLVATCGRDACHRCGEKITSVSEMSIEHIDPWQSHADPVRAFFDLSNISFSHRRCNYAAAEHPRKERTQEDWRQLWREKKKSSYTPEKRRSKWLRKKQ